MTTYSDHIAALSATRAEKSSRQKAVHQSAIDDGRTMNTAEAEEFDTLDSDIKAIDVDLGRTKRLQDNESADMATAKAVSGETKANATAGTVPMSRDNLQLKSTDKLAPGISFARYARVKALAHLGDMNTRDPAAIAKMIYPNDEVLSGTINKAAVPAANTMSPTWAGAMINDGPFADFVEYLRPRSLLGQISGGLRSLPFDTNVLIQGSGGAAKWVKEGEAKPLTQWAYTSVKLSPLKVAS